MSLFRMSFNKKRIQFVVFLMVVSTFANTGLITPIPHVQAADMSYYVGGDGASDDNPGTADQPFATIQQAASVATAGDTVKIRSGTYRETVTPAHSGTADNPIVYEPDGDADVTVSGTDIVDDSGWTPYKDSIYQHDIELPVTGYNDHMTDNTTLLANQVFVDGKMMIEARWPNVSNSDDLLNRSDFRAGSNATWEGVPQLRINAGGPLVDYQQLEDQPYPDGRWFGDSYPEGQWGYEGFSGGVYATENVITNTYSVGDALKDARYGEGHYKIDAPNGIYQVKLDWAEIKDDVAAGDRVFNVKINGTEVLTGLDIFTLAGGKDRGWEAILNNIAVTDGQMDIEFVSVTGEPMISELELNFQKPMNMTDEGIPDIEGGWTGGQIWVNGWYSSETAEILAQSGKTLTIDANPGSNYRDYYYLTGKLGALDAEKEWFYDGAKLYLRAPGSGSPTNVEVKKRNYAFDLSGQSYITLRNIHVFAATITSDSNSSDITIDGMLAQYINHYVTLPDPLPGWEVIQAGNSHQSETGIRLMGPNNTIRNSVIEYSAGNGIALGGINGIATNNLIHDVSYGGKFESGIWPAPNLNSNTVGVPQTITHNTIYRTGRSAIHGIYMNKDIGYNDFYYFGLINTDLGALYTDCGNSGCPGTNTEGTRIHHNWLHDAKAGDHQASGVYFDQSSGSGALVDHNVFWNNREVDLYENATINDHARAIPIQVYNNTFASQAPVLSFLTYDNQEIVTPDIFKNNIYNSGYHRGAYSNPANENYVSGDNSINKNTDPLFADKAGFDFHLQSGSPAIDSGTEIAGVTDGYAGSAPDKGAYEYGGEDWVPGYVQIPGGIPAPAPWEPTPPPVPSSITLQAENYDAANSVSNYGDRIGGLTAGSWISFHDVNLGDGFNTFRLRYANGEGAPHGAEVRLDSTDGPLIGTTVTDPTGNWTTWAEAAFPLTGASGVHDIYLVFSGASNYDWFVFENAPPAPASVQLDGSMFGTYGDTWSDYNYDYVFDGNTSTFFDSKVKTGAYVGIDLGAGYERAVTKIRFYPRPGLPGRMVGGKFQGSNTSETSGYTDLYTITSSPADGWNEVAIPDPTAYRYLRYIAGENSSGNIAELEFYGEPVPATGIAVKSTRDLTAVQVGHTLQMSAAVSPGNATDAAATWSVEAGTGAATIDASGALTGTAEGAVTVKATATDGSGVIGTMDIDVTSAPVTVSLDAYYVSVDGDDANPGTLEEPFQTIQKAASVAREGDTVYIRGGTYRETIEPANSGSEGYPITFQPYNDEAVTISGADIVDDAGWTVYQGDIYEHDLALPLVGYKDHMTDNTTLMANQVFADGKMMIEARWPNVSDSDDLLNRDDFRSAANGTWTGLSENSMSLDDDGIPDIDWTGGLIWYNGWYWSNTAPITASQPGSITFGDAPSSEYREYYYLTGKLGALDAEKEWFYDGTKLYFRAPGSGSPTNVEVKTRNYAFDLSGKSYITLKNIGVFAASITSDSNSSDVVVDGLQAEYINHYVSFGFPLAGWQHVQGGNAHQGETGIRLMGADNVIENSVIAHAAGNGIALGGANSVANNNLIHDVSYGGRFESGIWPAPNLNQNTVGVPQTITHNTIYRTGRSAIHGIYMNKDIGYNNFYDFGLINTDLGALYTDCDSSIAGCPGTNTEGTRIHHNWFHDAKAANRQASGIYFDQSSGSGAVVDHNVIWNSLENDAYENAVINDFHRPVPIQYYNNTFASEQPVFSFLTYDTGDITPDIFKNNIYSSLFLSPWKDQIADEDNSLTNDINPLFVNRNEFYFRLQESSPAVDTGVEIPGITDGYAGSAPDKGAYEYGGEDWIPGYRAPGDDTPPPTPPPTLHYPTVSVTEIPGGMTGTLVEVTATASTPCDVMDVKYAANGETVSLGEQSCSGASDSYTYTASFIPEKSGTYTVTAYATSYPDSDPRSATNSSSVTFTVVPNPALPPEDQIINDTVVGDGTELNQFHYVGEGWLSGPNEGAYMNDEHFSAVTDNYYEVKFYGIGIEVYSQKSGIVGIGAYSIDGGEETFVDHYNPTELPNSLVYTSPELSDSYHTLKVRVTGDKNNSSSNTWIVADRVIVKAGLTRPPVAVTGIAVTGAGAATTVHKGDTLQMMATISPADATDTDVIWSVEAGTGAATIDASGLLSATEEGTVTVKATAHDGSDVTGTAVITVTSAPSTEPTPTPSTGPTPTPSTEPTPTAEPTPTPTSGQGRLDTDGDGNKVWTLETDESELLHMLSGESDSLLIDATPTEEVGKVVVELSGAVAAQAGALGKPIVIESGGVRFKLDPGTWGSQKPGTIRIGWTVVSEPTLPNHFKAASAILDFELSAGDEDVHELGKPIEVSFAIDPSVVRNPKKLGIYYYDESLERWIYVGGKLNDDGTLSAMLQHFSQYAAFESELTFDDIQGHWAQEVIEELAAKQIVFGLSDSLYSPDGKLTRAQFVSLIVRALKLPKATEITSFADVPEDVWYKDDIDAAYQANIATGRSETLFVPQEEVSREEMAVLLMRAYRYVKGQSVQTAEEAQAMSFPDEANISPWAAESVRAASYLGLIEGFEDGSFAPRAIGTRAQAAALLSRLLDAINR